MKKGILSSKPLYKPSSKQEKLLRWEEIKSTYVWSANVNYRQNPTEYRVGKGEQGVLICEPYKSEILPHWRFKNPITALKSATYIFFLFEEYLKNDEFVGADLARKYLQMGYTRARRYANYKSGRKYDSVSGKELPLNVKDTPKEESAKIFYEMWKKAEANPCYYEMKHNWKKRYG